MPRRDTRGRSWGTGDVLRLVLSGGHQMCSLCANPPRFSIKPSDSFNGFLRQVAYYLTS